MKTFILLTCLFAGTLYAHPSFLPHHDLKIPVGMKSVSGGLTEEEFHEAADEIYALYYPLFKEKGGDFYIDRKWKDPTVNAYADLKGSLRKITIFGGMARFESMTKDAFSLVICHELGHHIGGAPKSPESSWASIEGQADYFASLKCVRRLWLNDDNAEIVSHMDIPTIVKESCQKQFTKTEEAICLRTGVAGLVVAKLFSYMSGSAKLAQYETPDLKVVTQTYTGHPASQCRLDTFFQGALCDKSFNENVSDVDEVKGTCHSRSGDKVGLRPACWFKARSF